MHSHSDKTRFLAYLIALSLFFSVAENMIVHPLPFLRYGFAMIPMLFALDKLNFKEYMALSIGKWLASTLSQGTMLSPFSIIALSSSISSALIMYVLFHVFGKFISLYTISLISSIVSTITQLLVASLFLGSVLMRISIVMLPLSEITGLLTAFLALHLKLNTNPPEIINTDNREDSPLTIILHILCALLVFFIKEPLILLLIFIIAITLSLLQKRKVLYLNYIITFLAVTVCNLFSRNGEVLFWFITKGALEEGIVKGLQLVSLVAISQSFAALRIKGGSFLSSVFAYNAAFISNFSKENKSIFKKLEEALCIEDGKTISITRKDNDYKITAILVIALILEIIFLLL
ncbi:MAG: Gx transporter family protein [Spirochaetales bacterium]|nr:Gx transporter family protein [Spirochaetales bacterium]MDD7270558.1 Gx transporter family protein [Spirochaetales bacterium]